MIFDTSLGNFGTGSDACSMVETARAADQLGFRALWGGDHLLPPTSMPEYGRLFEPLVSLAYVASQTRRIKLGTSVIVLPMRNPFVVAKQVATLDALSGGRVILGIAVGWSIDEFANVHADFQTRGARLEESIRLFRHLWSGTQAAFEGRFYSYPGGLFDPVPAQGAELPLLIGGRSDLALERVARHAAFWHMPLVGVSDFPPYVTRIRAEPGGERVEVGGALSFSGDQGEAQAAVDQWAAAGAQYVSVNFGPPEGRIERMHLFARAFLS